MAMGNFCYIQSIECPYATVLGTCRDDIYSDFNKCEMNGDDMPTIEWPPHERRSWCVNQHAHWEVRYICSKCGETVRRINSLLFTFLCGCTQNTQFEPTEQPHLYWKDIDVVVENSDEYQLTYTDEFAGSGAFGYPEQGNYRKGDIVKAEMYSWVMDSTGEIVRQEIHKVY